MFPLVGVIGVHDIGGRICSMHSGKDEFCDGFITTMKELSVSYERRAFGDSVKEDLAKMLGVSTDFINANKKHFRLMMQGYATDYIRNLVARDHWIKRFREFLNSREVPLLAESVSYIVPDVRFADECRFIKSQGGLVVRVTRTSPVTYALDADALKHESERNVADLPYDAELVNIGDCKEEFAYAVSRFTKRFYHVQTGGKLHNASAQGQTVSGGSEPHCACHEGAR